MAEPARIVDAHYHIWRKDDLPWLKGPMIPRILEPYEPIRRDCPSREYLTDGRPHGIVKVHLCPDELGSRES